MWKGLFLSCFIYITLSPAFATDYQSHIDSVLHATYNACGKINQELKILKTMAGINTAVTATGTVSSGIALGTGIKKASIDVKAEKIEAELQNEIQKLNQLAITQTHIDILPEFEPDNSDKNINTAQKSINDKQTELDELTKKSKTLGNIRTGTLAGTAVTDIAGTIIATQNKIDDDLQSKINECVSSVNNLSNAYMQLRISEPQNPQLPYIQNIIRECEPWATVDLSKINKNANNSAVSSGIGAAMSIAGTITSASANSDQIRNNNSQSGKSKEKKLNTASNVMAGGAAAASGIATIFNATQISTIKQAMQIAEKCEQAMNK